MEDSRAGGQFFLFIHQRRRRRLTRMSERATAKDARERVLKLAADWIQRRQGSAAELIRDLEDEVGWPARHLVVDALDELRSDNSLEPGARKYLTYTLNAGAVREALADGLN